MILHGVNWVMEYWKAILLVWGCIAAALILVAIVWGDKIFPMDDE